MAIMPGSYRQLLRQTEGCVGGPEVMDLINQFRLDKIFLPSLATFNYIIDCAGGKYLHLSSLYDEILGYKKEIISDKGPKFFAILCLSLIHI